MLKLANHVHYPRPLMSWLSSAVASSENVGGMTFVFDSNDPANGFPAQGCIAVRSIEKVSRGNLPNSLIVRGVGYLTEPGFKEGNFTFTIYFHTDSLGGGFILIEPARTLVLSFSALCSALFRNGIRDPNQLLGFFDGDPDAKYRREHMVAINHERDFNKVLATTIPAEHARRMVWYKPDPAESGSVLAKVKALNIFLVFHNLPVVPCGDQAVRETMQCGWASWLQKCFAVHGQITIEMGFHLNLK